MLTDFAQITFIRLEMVSRAQKASNFKIRLKDAEDSSFDENYLFLQGSAGGEISLCPDIQRNAAKMF